MDFNKSERALIFETKEHKKKLYNRIEIEIIKEKVVKSR